MDVETQVNERDLGEFVKIANDVQLPAQVMECLLQSGYDTVSAVATLVDFKPIETFLREHFFLFEDSPKRFNIYGSYCSFPDKFSFVPGHVVHLNKFIAKCKIQSKKQASSKKKKFVRGSSNKSACSSAMYRVLKACVARNNICADVSTEAPGDLGPTLLQDPESFSQVYTSLYDVSEHVTSGHCEDINGKDSVNISPSKTFTRDSSSSLELMIHSDIKRKLEAWCSKHSDSKVRNLQLEQHYRIKVTRKIAPDDPQKLQNDPESSAYISPDKLQFDVSLVCCICSRCVRLHIRKNSYAISNASRHLISCARKRKEDG